MQPLWLCLTASCLAILTFAASASQAATPLPEFTSKGVALRPKDLAYAPAGRISVSLYGPCSGAAQAARFGKHRMACAMPLPIASPSLKN